MNRCTPALPSPTAGIGRCLHAARTLLAAASLTALTCFGTPALAQVQPGLGVVRNFPDASLRGTLTIQGGSEAVLSGRTIRMAPGMRLFSPQNSLVMLHTVQGKTFKVNYLIENSTGMLLSAWILTEGEAAQPRNGSDTIQFNFRTDADPAKK
ncbi:MAG: hypothetical protein EON50_11040 [Acidovorax sp.]|nr:MAG: hypothetical protein EON50_11040 [Acidovorax sp.]